MRAYDLLVNVSARPSTPFPPGGPFEQQPPTAKPKKKRSTPGEGPSPPTLQAQPFTSVYTAGDPVPYTATVAPLPHKKRGRPNKEEHERRVREAAERGEVYPPPRKTKTPRQSFEGVVGAVDMSGVPAEGSKKYCKKAKTAPAKGHLAAGIPARTSSLEGTGSGPTSMRTETEDAARSTTTDTHTTEYPARGGFLTGLREHAATAAQAEPDTVQSNSMLEQALAPERESDMVSATINSPMNT